MSINNLFLKILPVIIKSKDTEEKKIYLSIQVCLLSNGTAFNRKILEVKLTNESDLYFLYTLSLNEDDFQNLKVQQGLLVDFTSFPQKFIDLLELCLHEEHRESPKFLLNLVTGNPCGDRGFSCLEIIEANQFKHLVHLSLKFVPATDGDVKKYLANCLQNAKDENKLLSSELHMTERDLKQKLGQTQQILTSKSTELEKLKSEWSLQTTNLTALHAREITTEREKALQIQANCQQKLEQERRELEHIHAKSKTQLESRNSELEIQNKDLTDAKYKLDSIVHELKLKVSTLDGENHQKKQELSSLRKSYSSLEDDVHQKDKLLHQLNTKVAGLEQELIDKEQLLKRCQSLLEGNHDQKKQQEALLDQKQSQIKKKESDMKIMGEDILKGNQIIKKLQGEIRGYHSKLKLRAQIAIEQEKLLAEKDLNIDQLRQELGQLGQKVSDMEKENKILKENVEKTTNQLEENMKVIHTNENVINWLNRQLNESHVMSTGTQGLISSTVRSSSQHNMNTPFSSRTNSGVLMAHPQVIYNPSKALHSRPNSIPPIPEEMNPYGPPPVFNRENQPPLDAKYFQRRDDSLKGGIPFGTHGMSSQNPSIPKQITTATKLKNQPPLMAAYCPKQTYIT